MTQLKTLVINNFNTLTKVVGISILSLLLLMVRLKLTHSFYLLFLVWNLFLAFIPLVITFYLKSKPQLSKWKLGLYFFAWLLFLPNAPYIITDLIHLQLSEGLLVYLDAIIIITFAISGLYFYVLSIRDMREVVSPFISKRLVKLLFIVLPFLCGFGIYLGRFLRFNSWDLLRKPMLLVFEIIDIVIHPIENWIAWGVTILIGIFLFTGNQYFKNSHTL